MIYLLLWAHFVCDFMLQTDAMAKGKSSSNVWLGKHIAVYSLGLMVFISLTEPKVIGMLAYVALNGLAHFCTDYVTSRITKKLWAENQVHNFFVVIGFDQAVHMTTLFITIPILSIGTW